MTVAGQRTGRTRLGFTLVEIVVVLVILGMAAAVVVPPLRAVGRDHGTQAAAIDVAQVLRAARRIALEQAVPVVVTIAATSRHYVVEADRGDSVTMLAEGTLPPAVGVRLTNTLPRARFVFDRLGPAQPDSITVQDDRGTAVVGVDRWSGDVYVRTAGR